MTTARTTPTGDMLENGYQTLMAFSADADVDIWEKGVQPPGLEGGEKVDITTMHNTTVHTYAAQALIEMTDMSMTAAYDPAVISQIIALVNVNGEITVHFPDTSTWDFYGYLRSFVPSENVNGTQPEAACTVVATNVNSGTGAEHTPVYTAPAP